MLKSLFLLTFCLCGSILSQRQPNQDFCNRNAPPTFPDEPIPVTKNVSALFYLSVERNRNDRGETEEIQEFYDGADNLGVVHYLMGGIDTRSYSYVDLDQLLVISGQNCKVYELSKNLELTEFFVTTVDGKPHIISGLNLVLQNANIKFKYIGDSNSVRGIPVKEWQTCLATDKATLKITLSYSTPGKWTPAIINNDFPSVPVQYKIEGQDFDTNKEWVEYDVITQFRPGNLLKKEDFQPSRSVFCPDRKHMASEEINFRPPEQFSFIAHVAQSNKGASDYTGQLSVVGVDIDYTKQLARYDFYVNGQRITDIHDLDAGVSYFRNHYTRECKTTALDPNSPEPHHSYDFFQFNKTNEPKFQYTGKWKSRDILVDGFIAPRKFGKLDANYEWYFMSDGYTIQENFAQGKNEPVALVIRPTDPEYKDTPTYIEFSNFDRTRINYFDFDVSKCGESTSEHYKFSFDSKFYNNLRDNINIVKLEIILNILKVTELKALRVAQLDTIFDDGILVVIFTILDKPTVTGNPNAKPEPSIGDAISKLTNAINNDQFTFTFTDSNNNVISATASKNSLEKIKENTGRYSFTVNDYVDGYDGGSLAGFIIGFLLIGTILGLVGGIFLILRRSNPISLPGPLSVFNPTYNKAGGSSA